MKCKYEKLMSPVKVGGTMLKNRLINTPHDIHFIQGSEPWPTEAVILWLAERAKNGCALINVSGIGVHKVPGPGHMWSWDMTDGHTQHYLSQLTDAIHFYGAKVNAFFKYDLRDMFPGKDISTGKATHWTYGDGSQPRYDQVAASTDELEAFIEDFAQKVYSLKMDCGFDGLFMNMSYRASSFGRMLSPLINDRADKFGGSLENRCRYAQTIALRVRELCGPEFIIECTVSADPEGSGGNTEDDLLEIVRQLDGYFDIITLKAPEIDPAHCVQFQPRTPWLYLAEKAKRIVKSSLISSSGGYLDPEEMEHFLQEDKLDLIGTARAWIADPQFGTKVYENRADDIVPCVRCNKCHHSSMADPWSPYCTVNPLFGWRHREKTMFGEPTTPKKVAVIGGGPAGMEAAIVASRRGHSVTLYEKCDHLGGQLDITKDVDFKYPLQDFKKYLIHQVGKSAVDVRLNCAPTAEQLKAEDYDVVIAAVGSVPAVPPIAGIDGANVVDFTAVYEDREKLGQNVVVIGGGEIGAETAMYIAQTGRNVSVIEMKDRLATDSTPVHYYSIFEQAYLAMKNLTPVCNATCTGITAKGVTYRDKDGNEHFIAADSVVICAGMKAKSDEAYGYYTAGDRFHIIGDCYKVGNVQTAMRVAYAIADSL